MDARLVLPYPKINIIFAGIILVILVYSGVFSSGKDNHPIPSFYELAKHKPSPSRGLSRSFSEIMRFRFESAAAFNSNGLRIFLFFFIQLFLRLGFTCIYLRSSISKTLLVSLDIGISVGLFLYAFWNFLAFWKFY